MDTTREKGIPGKGEHWCKGSETLPALCSSVRLCQIPGSPTPTTPDLNHGATPARDKQQQNYGYNIMLYFAPGMGTRT